MFSRINADEEVQLVGVQARTRTAEGVFALYLLTLRSCSLISNVISAKLEEGAHRVMSFRTHHMCGQRSILEEGKVVGGCDT